MRYYPQGAYRLSLGVKRHQQRFDDRRIDRTVIEVPSRIREQERGVAVEHDPRRSTLARHMIPYLGRESPSDRVPAEYACRAPWLQDADSGGMGIAQVEGRFHEFL